MSDFERLLVTLDRLGQICREIAVEQGTVGIAQVGLRSCIGIRSLLRREDLQRRFKSTRLRRYYT
jgi:hypothetical protein